MNRKQFVPVLVLMLAVIACSIQTTSPTTVPVISTDTSAPLTPSETAVITDTPAGPTAAPGGLTLDMLRNGTYHTPFFNRTVTLVNGSYSEGSGATLFKVDMLAIYGFGDLDGNGKADAAIVLAENSGGSGTFESLIAVTNQSGAPHQAGQAQLGDRVLVNSIDISSGVIHLDMVVQGPADPLCCPSLPQKQNYWLIGNRLWLMRVNSTVGGTEHTINIDSPGHWSSVANPFTVAGNVSVLPFENTLAYHIYLIDGTVVNQSSLTVTPAGGITGTFSRVFNLSAAGITDWVIIQFVETSAADGSTIALGSVILKAH